AYADVQAELFQRMCTYDPRLRSISGRGPAVDPLPQPTEYTFAQGEVCDRGSKRQPPHQPKRNMTLTLTLPAVNDESNGVLVSAGSFRFGYTLRLDEGVLRFATQRWQNEPVVLETPLAATAEPVNIAARWMRGGAIALCVNGTEVAAGNAGGDMPATTGREIRDTAGSVAVGRSINGPDCIPLLSDTPDDDTYTATITDVKLNLLNH
ncbi:MAG: hypothetical protein QGH15_21330, partial [Kiritimatiellia bacterium]|nr:hypothetical protein [Kiritimatiellia bacterium]